jgi:hypothetical protein
MRVARVNDGGNGMTLGERDVRDADTQCRSRTHPREGGTIVGLRAVTTRGTDTALDEPTIQGFKSSLRGPLLRPGDAGCDAARQICNRMIDRHPAFIVRCVGVADVTRRSTSPAGTTCWWQCAVVGTAYRASRCVMGGWWVDLSAMRSVRVDSVRRTARGPGRRHLGRFRPRDAGLRSGHDGRHRLDHGDRRPHAGGRHWLFEPLLVVALWPLERANLGATERG